MSTDSFQDIYFNIFKAPQDHRNWDKHIEYASRQSDLGPAIQADLQESLHFLKAELGEQFLKQITVDHPLFRRITEKSPWRTMELIDLVQSLERLKNEDPGYVEIVKKLRSANRCQQEGLPFLGIAQMYFKVGCKVRFPVEQKRQINPDIHIYYPASNDNFYIEVSQLGESDERKSMDENFKQLSYVFNFEKYQLPFSCKQLRYILPEEMPSVLNIIRTLQKKAFSEKQICFHQDDKIRLAIAHPDKYDLLEKWIAEHDYRKGLQGIALDFDETYRISNNKVGRKAGQIPLTESGLIYIPLNALFFWIWDPIRTICEIELELSKYPNVYGVVLYAYLIHNVDPVSQHVNGHFYSIKKVNEVVIRHLLFIKNNNYNGMLSKETIDMIHSTFS